MGEVNWEQLSCLQAYATEGLLSSTMLAYLKWVAPQMDVLKMDLPKRQKVLRDDVRANHNFGHDRTSDILANLLVGLDLFLRFAIDEGGLSPERAEEYRKMAYKSLITLGYARVEQHRSQEPTEIFLESLQAVGEGSCGKCIN